MPTFINNRSGRSVTTDFTNEEAMRRFAEGPGKADANHWLWYWIHTYALEHRPAGEAAPRQQMSKALTFIGDLFVVALGQGLKNPMIRLHYKGQRFKFYLSRRGTVCLKSGKLAPITVTHPVSGETVNATYHPRRHGHPDDCRGCTEDQSKHGQVAYSRNPEGDEEYVGCLLAGRFLPARVGMTDRWAGNGQRDSRPLRVMTEVEKDFLARLENDPVAFFAECSRDMDRCCYCGNPLEDQRSKDVGYGETCAGRWGLPWGSKEYVEKAPSFSKEYGLDASALIAAIRQNPEADGPWLVFADWLQDRGLRRCEKPESTARMPRA